MRYATLYKKNNTIKAIMPPSLNDPYNQYSYSFPVVENLLPVDFSQTVAKELKIGTNQQAIQQQLIQIKSQQLAEQRKADSLAKDKLQKLSLAINLQNQAHKAEKAAINILQDEIKTLKSNLNYNGGY